MRKIFLALIVFMLMAVNSYAFTVGSDDPPNMTTPAFESYAPDPAAADQGVADTTNITINNLLTQIGTTNNATMIVHHNESGATTAYHIGTSIDLSSYPELMFHVEKGAFFVPASGVTIKFYSPENFIVGDAQRMFDFSSGGTVSFSIPGEARVDWWGKTAAGLQAAFNGLISGSSLKVSGGELPLGTTSVDFDTGGEGKTIDLVGVGSGYVHADVANQGTTITCSGAGYGLRLSSKSSLRHIRISGGGSGVTGLILGGAISPIPWVGELEDVYITGFTGVGLQCEAVQLGTFNNFWSNSNTGIGMIVVGNNNTHADFYGSAFRQNRKEGVIYTGSNISFKYHGSVNEANWWEGFKFTTGASNNVVDGMWFEQNQLDPTRTDGYYQVVSGDSTASRNKFVNCHFNVAANAWNGTAGNKHIRNNADLIVQDCFWIGTPPYVDIIGSGQLTDIGDGLGINSVSFSAVQGYYYNATGKVQVWEHTESELLPRTAGVLHTNSGATAGITLTNPPVETALDNTFSVKEPFPLNIDTTAGDQTNPLTFSPGVKIRNIGKVGDSISMVGSSVTDWNATSQIGAWVSADSGGISSSQRVVEIDVLSAATVTALRASPYTLIDATTNCLTEVESVTLVYNYSGATFIPGADENLRVEWGTNKPITETIETIGFLDQANDEVFIFQSGVSNTTDLVPEVASSVIIRNTGSGEIGGGDTSTLTIFTVFTRKNLGL